jgi:hypothetical protein
MMVKRSVLLALVYSTCSDAFVPRIPLPKSFGAISRHATLEMEQTAEGLSDMDVEILFGNNTNDLSPSNLAQSGIKDRAVGNIRENDPKPSDPLHQLDYSSSDPLIHKLSKMRATLQSCPNMWLELEKHCPTLTAVYDAHMCDGETIDWTFQEVSAKVQSSATLFANLGITKGMHVAILGENSAKWLVADHGIQLAGGVSAVRGADAPLDELRYIYEHSDSAGVAVLQGPKLFKQLANDARAKQLEAPLGLYNEKYGNVKTIVLLHKEKMSSQEISQLGREHNVEVHVFSDMLDRAEPMAENLRPQLGREDLATIVYTSGELIQNKSIS